MTITEAEHLFRAETGDMSSITNNGSFSPVFVEWLAFKSDAQNTIHNNKYTAPQDPPKSCHNCGDRVDKDLCKDCVNFDNWCFAPV